MALVNLQSVLNVAKTIYKNRLDFSAWQNPVSILSEARAWNEKKRRTRVIPKEKLGAWFNAVVQFGQETSHATTAVACDYLLFVLLTGLRRNEAAKLEWRNVFREDGHFVIPQTKNHQPHRLPLPDYLQTLLDRRWRSRVNEYVFPGHPNRGNEGCLSAPVGLMRKIAERTGVEFSIHDLRRTFASLAEYLNMNDFTIKKLLNHKIERDITGGYISKQFDANRLRKPTQQITDFVLNQAGLKQLKERVLTIKLSGPTLHKLEEAAKRKSVSPEIFAIRRLASALGA